MDKNISGRCEEKFDGCNDDPMLFIYRLLNSITPGWYFRGQSDYSWELEPSLVRIARNVNRTGDIRAIENSLIGEFKRTFNSGYHTRPDDSDLVSWLTLMQHYKVPTRLIDWSLSPLIALYFATDIIKNENGEEVDGAIWCYSPYDGEELRNVTPWNHVKLLDEIEDTQSRADSSFSDFLNGKIRYLIAHNLEETTAFAPTWIDQRMSAQQSVFTLSGRAEMKYEVSPYDEWDLCRAKHVDPNIPEKRFIKIRVDKKLKVSFQILLTLLGISPASLFPGLDGIGESIARLQYRTFPPNDILNKGVDAPKFSENSTQNADEQ